MFYEPTPPMCQGIMYTGKKTYKYVNGSEHKHDSVDWNQNKSVENVLGGEETKNKKQRTTESNTTTHACRQTSSLHAEIRPFVPVSLTPSFFFPLHTSGSGCTIDDARQQLSSHQHHHLIAIPSSIIHTLIIAFGVVSWSLSLSSDPFYRRLLLMCVAPAISYEFFGYVTNRHHSIARETGRSYVYEEKSII